MSNRSIFEYLTLQNPKVTHPDTRRGNTSSWEYYVPKKLEEWHDFNLGVLRGLYEGKMMNEALKERGPFEVPEIDRLDSDAHDEIATRSLLDQWTINMTRKALRAVADVLHPTTWCASLKKPKKRFQKEEGENPQQPIQRTPGENNKEHVRRSQRLSKKAKVKKPRQRKINSRLRVDSSSVTICEPCEQRDAQSDWGTKERMPKEIKVYPKFSTKDVLDRVDRGLLGSNEAVDKEMPLRQAFTYCVDSGCRYGCILTAYEAFVFRIGLMVQDENSRKILRETYNGDIRRALAEAGLVEYKVIPWDNYRKPNCSSYEDLTINFSLWVLHILAGNGHELQWPAYKHLHEETLVEQPCPLFESPSDIITVPDNEQGEENIASPTSSSTTETTERNVVETADDPLTETPSTPDARNTEETEDTARADGRETPHTSPPLETPSRKRQRWSEDAPNYSFDGERMLGGNVRDSQYEDWPQPERGLELTYDQPFEPSHFERQTTGNDEDKDREPLDDYNLYHKENARSSRPTIRSMTISANTDDSSIERRAKRAKSVARSRT